MNIYICTVRNLLYRAGPGGKGLGTAPRTIFAINEPDNPRVIHALLDTTRVFGDALLRLHNCDARAAANIRGVASERRA